MENCLIPQPYFMDYMSGMRNYNTKKNLSQDIANEMW